MHDFKTDNAKELDFNKGNQALHGDVIIESLGKVPKGFDSLEKLNDPVLAYGEITGHSHRLFRKTDIPTDGNNAFDLRITRDGFKLLKVNEPIEVRHQEHDPRIIPPGIYKIGIQREYDPFTKLARSVAD